MFTNTNQPTYTPIPSGIIEAVAAKLAENNISYKILCGADIPVECDGEYVEIAGRKFTRFACIEANAESNDIIKYAESLLS